MCRWKSRARGCRRGSRASRQLRSAPLCLCNGKNPLGTRRKNINLRSPQHSKAGPGRPGMREREQGMGRWWWAPPEPQRCSGPAQGGANPGSAQRPPSLGLRDTEPLLRDAPQETSALAIIGISRLCCLVGKAEAVEGKCSTLARKNFLRWRLSPHCCDLWGLARPRLHPHTHTHAHVSSPAFPALLPHNFWSGNIILVSGKSSSDC